MIKTQRVIVIADTSGSMSGQPIEDIKKALITLNKQVHSINGRQERVMLQIITFSDKAKFISRNNIKSINADGETNLAEGYKKLNLIFKNNKTFNHPPIILLLCDGCPNQGNHNLELKKLSKYWAFNKSLKIAFAYKSQTVETMKILTDFTGNKNNVFMESCSSIIKKIIERTLHKIIEKNHLLNNKSNQKVLVKIMADDIKVCKGKGVIQYAIKSKN